MSIPKRKLLVLDLDETLVHSSEVEIADYDFICRIGGSTFWVKKRPDLDSFLKRVSQIYDLMIWSAGGDDYVRAVVKVIMEGISLVNIFTHNRCVIKYRPLMGDENCDSGTTRYSYVIKPLIKIWRKKKWSRQDTVVVDDCKTTFQRNYGNSIQISEFTGQNVDFELDRVLRILEELVVYDNVRFGLQDIQRKRYSLKIITQT